MTAQMVRLLTACCTSGLCIDCHSRGNHGDRARRTWQDHFGRPVPRAQAEKVAEGWRDYSPRIVDEPLVAARMTDG